MNLNQRKQDCYYKQNVCVYLISFSRFKSNTAALRRNRKAPCLPIPMTAAYYHSLHCIFCFASYVHAARPPVFEFCRLSSPPGQFSFWITSSNSDSFHLLNVRNHHGNYRFYMEIPQLAYVKKQIAPFKI